MTPATPAQRFWRLVRKDPSGCWLWVGAIAADTGYGVFNDGHKSVLAHLFAFSIVFPSADRTDKVVRHTCDVRHCVNPRHLVLGTQAENMADMDARGRRVNNPVSGEDHPNAKMTRELVDEARRLWAAGASARALALRFGVSSTTMDAILRGETWKT